MIIHTDKAVQRINDLKRTIGNPRTVANAEKMALNDAIRFGKTEVKRSIMAVYNLKASRITDSNRKKGLKIKPASVGNLEATITAGHLPANLGSFTGTRASKRNGVSVEIVKGKRKRIPSAFRLFASQGTKGASGVSGNKNVIFARGKKVKPRFVFTKPRMPIAPLSSVSVATAALNVKAQQKYGPTVQRKYEQRMLHHLQRIVNTV